MRILKVSEIVPDSPPHKSSLEDVAAGRRTTITSMDPETTRPAYATNPRGPRYRPSLQDDEDSRRSQPKSNYVQASGGEQKRVSFMSIYQVGIKLKPHPLNTTIIIIVECQFTEDAIPCNMHYVSTTFQHANEIPGLDYASSSVIYFHDLSHIELIMKVIGLMCDGQYREMQDFIRAQSEQMHGVGLVGEVTTFLQTFHRNQHLDSGTIKTLHRMLQTLIEMSVGNHANQRAIFNRQILPVVNRILQVDISDIKPPPQGRWVNIAPTLNSSQFDGDDINSYPWYYQYEPQAIPPETFKELKKQALDLKGSAIELLEGMLEETSPKTKDLVTRLSGGLDIDALHGTMVDFYKLKSDKELKKDEYDDNAERGMYRTYHILIQLQYYNVPLELGMYLKVTVNCEY